MKRSMNCVSSVVVAMVGAAALTVAPVMSAHADDDVQPATTTAAPAPAKSMTVKLKLDPTILQIDASSKVRIGYMPIQIPLTTTKPAGVKKEPTYRTTPKYGVLHVGNGPKSAFTIAVDEPADGDYKIYVDVNHNGDLTDDGDGSWVKKTSGARVEYGVNSYTLRASWGTDKHETGSGQYGFSLYRFVGQDFLLGFRTAARTGEVNLDGKKHKMLLIENDADAVYSKTVPTDDKGQPTGKVETRPVWLVIDSKDDGKFSGPSIDIRGPFKLGDKVYEADVTPDGYKLKLTPTTKVVAELTPKPAPRPALLATGSKAPVFTAEANGGGSVQLSDYKGKILILDFWATWCGPCQASMPHIEKVYEGVKDKGVAVLALCVWDDKKAYEGWIPTHKDKFTFPLAFDPAGRATKDSIAMKLFNVSGIPTTYIIDKDGNVADAIVGFGGADDKRVEAALKKLGVEIPTEVASK